MSLALIRKIPETQRQPAQGESCLTGAGTVVGLGAPPMSVPQRDMAGLPATRPARVGATKPEDPRARTARGECGEE